MKTPPGPPPHRWYDLPRTARSIADLVRDPIGFVGRRFAEFGDTYRVIEPGGHLLYVTRDPAVVRDVLVTKARDFRKRGGANDRLVPVLGEGLLTADGEAWKTARRAMNPRFHHRAIGGYARTMVEHADELVWADGQTVDVSAAMMELTLRIVCKALFDHDVRGETDRVAATMEALRVSVQATIVPAWVPTPGRYRAKRAIADIDALIAGLIEERRGSGLRDDLVSMLLDVGFDDRTVRDQLVTLFLAGHETTSHALSWTWWLLAHHPEVEARLHAEVDAADELGADTELPWTDAVVAESMRLFPPAYAIPRVAATDTEVGGWPLPAGTQIVSWVWHVHHDPKHWSDAEDFRPERFLAPAHDPTAYLPFGAGTRMCIGAGFARMELRLLLAALARRYRLVAAPAQTVDRLARVTLSPKGGLPLRVVAR